MKTHRALSASLTVIALAISSGACDEVATGQSAVTASSPTATMRAYYEAGKKKDTEALKKLISKASLKMMENPQVSVDRMLLATIAELPPAMPATRNEQIAGDTATLEVMNSEKRWETTHFVREDGIWKIAFDKSDKG